MASQLIEILAAARAAGFDTHHMVALPEVVFRIRFWKTNAATGRPDAGAGQLDAARVVETIKVNSFHHAPSKGFERSRGYL